MNETFKICISVQEKDLVIEAVNGKEHFKETFYGAILEIDCLSIYIDEFLSDYNDFLNKKIEVLTE